VKRSGDTHSHFTAHCIQGMLEAVLAGICFLGQGRRRGSYAMLEHSSLCYIGIDNVGPGGPLSYRV